MTAESMSPLRGAPPSSASTQGARIVGRYALYSEFAAGGMASVHFGRLLGAAGFARTVAVKRLHPQFAKDPEFVSMFVDEARLAARIRHPNVVQTLDVVQVEHELFLVMDYVHGDSLANLLKRSQARGLKVPGRVAVTILQHALFGLHAAHDARTERGEPLEIVHRDMSPHNVLVGVDGAARVLDFGIAKAGGRVQVTRDGQVKGKLSYLAPEQLTSEHAVDRRTDVYAAAATLWEALTGRRLVQGESDWQRMAQICAGETLAPSRVEPAVPPELDAVVMKGLAKNPADRYATARDMAAALESVAPHATAREVGEWVEEAGGDSLRRRAALVAEIESHSADTAPASYGDEPTVTRSDIGALIVAESSANRYSAPAAMARSLSSAPPPAPRPSVPSVRSDPSDPSMPSVRSTTSGSGTRSVRRVAAAAEEVEVERPARRRAILLPILVLLFAAAAGTVVFYTRPQALGLADVAVSEGPQGPASPPPAVAPSSEVLPSPAVAPAPSGQAAMPIAPVASAVTGAGDALPAASTTAAAIRVPAASPTALAPWKPWHAPVSASAASAAAAAHECDVPYTIDAEGIRHPKAQCL